MWLHFVLSYGAKSFSVDGKFQCVLVTILFFQLDYSRVFGYFFVVIPFEIVFLVERVEILVMGCGP